MLAAIDNMVLRFDRISKYDVYPILKQVEKNGSLTSQHAMMLIRCMGSFIVDEHPTERSKLVQDLWEKLPEYGLTPSVQHYNALLMTYLQNNHEFSPSEFLETMQKNDIEANRVTFQRLLGRYCELGDIPGASQILEHMKSHSLAINEYVFNSLILGHFRAGDATSAEGVLDIMRAAGLEPSRDTYSQLLKGYAEKGDKDALMKAIEGAKNDMSFMLPKHLLSSLVTATNNGHTDLIPVLIEQLQECHGFNRDAISAVNQLILYGHDEVALKVFDVMPKPRRPEDENSVGSYEALSAALKYMQDKRHNSDNIDMAVLMAYNYNKTDYAMELLDEMQKNNDPVRMHYFWPALCQYADQGNREGVVKILQQLKGMQASYEDLLSSLAEYGVSSLIKIGDTPEEVHATLQEIGYSEQLVCSALALEALMNHRLDDIPENTNLLMLTYSVVWPFVNGYFSKRHEWEKILALLSCCSLHKDGIHYNGIYLKEAVKLWKAEPVVVEQIMDAMIAKNLYVTNTTHEHISALLKEGDFPSSYLEKLDGLLSEKTSSRGSIEGLLNRSTEELNSLLQADPNNLTIQKWSMIQACKVGDIGRMEALDEKLKSVGFVHSVESLKQILLMYAFHAKDLPKSLEYMNRIKSEYPEYGKYGKCVLQIAIMQIEQGRFEDAVSLLVSFAEANESEIVANFGNSYFLADLCSDALDAAHKAGVSLQECRHLLEIFFKMRYVREGSVTVLRKHLEGVLEGGVPETILAELIYVEKTYDRWAHFHEILCFFIKNENLEHIQKAYDVGVNLFGERNCMHHLLLAFVDCGQVNKAKRLVETPGFRSIMPRLIDACQRFFHFNKVAAAEMLVDVTSGAYDVDREEMLFQLTLGYAKLIDVDKVNEMLLRFEELNIQPRERTMVFIKRFLDSETRSTAHERMRPERRSQEQIQLPTSNLNEAEREAVRFIQSGSIDEALALGARLKSVGDSTLYTNFVNNVAVAVDSTNDFRGFNALIDQLSKEGDIDTLESLLKNRILAGKMIITLLKYAIFATRVNNDCMDPLLNYLDSKPEETWKYLSISSLHTLETRNPEAYSRLEDIIKKISMPVEKARANVGMWTHLFLNQDDKATGLEDEIFPHGISQNQLNTLCYEAVKLNREEPLKRLLTFRKIFDRRVLPIVYSHLITLHCNNQQVDEALDVYSAMTVDGFTDTQLRRDHKAAFQSLLQNNSKQVPWKLLSASVLSGASMDRIFRAEREALRTAVPASSSAASHPQQGHASSLRTDTAS